LWVDGVLGDVAHVPRLRFQIFSAGVLLIAALVIWGIRRRPRLSSLLRLVILAMVGIFLLIVLQAGNNAVFDRMFPVVKVVNQPARLDAR
jgi:hypothetical protein